MVVEDGPESSIDMFQSESKDSGLLGSDSVKSNLMNSILNKRKLSPDKQSA